MPISAAATAPLTDEDRTTIGNMIAKFDKDMLAGNLPAVVSVYSEDAVLMPPNAPMVRGRMEIQQFFEAFPKITEFTQNPIEIAGTGGPRAHLRGDDGQCRLLLGWERRRRTRQRHAYEQQPPSRRGGSQALSRKEGHETCYLVEDLRTVPVPAGPLPPTPQRRAGDQGWLDGFLAPEAFHAMSPESPIPRDSPLSWRSYGNLRGAAVITCGVTVTDVAYCWGANLPASWARARTRGRRTVSSLVLAAPAQSGWLAACLPRRAGGPQSVMRTDDQRRGLLLQLGIGTTTPWRNMGASSTRPPSDWTSRAS
jgi:ketosteroid isomerase-like protein